MKELMGAEARFLSRMFTTDQEFVFLLQSFQS